MARLACLSVVLVAAVLSGCLPETRIAWSPDGKVALVRGGDGLYLCDGEGKLSPRVAENVTAMAWLPDSRQFIAACGQSLATWEELVPHLSDARKDAAMHEAAIFRAEVLARKGDRQKFRFHTPSADVRAALVCLRDTYGKELAATAGPAQSGLNLTGAMVPPWPGLKDLRYTIQHVRLFEVKEGKATEAKKLFESLEPMAEIRVSLSGKALAWTASPYPALGAEAAFTLYVAPLADPGRPAEVADRVSVFFDWTADGRSLVYAATEQPDPGGSSRAAGLDAVEEQLVYRRQHMPELARSTPRIGSIFKSMVVNEDGSLVDNRRADALAGVPFSDAMPVRCMKNGRALFAAADIRLPGPAGADQKLALLTLFTVTLDKPYDVKAAPAPEAKPEVYYRVDLFQLSPDETRVAVLNRRGLITIMDLATGKVDSVAATSSVLAAGLPAWRSNQELCFVTEIQGAEGAKSRPEVVLWTREGIRVLSKDWPEPVRKGWLDR